MKLTLDIFRILFVILLFSLPFYGAGLFWGAEYGEYYGIALSLSIIFLISLFSKSYVPRFLRASKNVKNKSLSDIVDNLSFVMGMEKINILEMNNRIEGVCFFKSWNGEGYLFLNSKALDGLDRNELNSILRLYLEIVKSSSSLRCLGGFLFYIMGLPFKFFSNIKFLSLISHFFVIPFHLLSRKLFSIKILKKRIIEQHVESDDISYLESAIGKLKRRESRTFNVFDEQMFDVLSFTKSDEKSIFNLLMENNKININKLELRTES